MKHISLVNDYEINDLKFSLRLINISFFIRNDPISEKAKLKKWGILHFSKKPKPVTSLQKGVEGATLTKEGICQVKQLVNYLSREECKSIYLKSQTWTII